MKTLPNKLFGCTPKEEAWGIRERFKFLKSKESKREEVFRLANEDERELMEWDMSIEEELISLNKNE